jgi:hypothetical protein
MSFFDDEEWEKLSNFMLFKIWATNKELNEMLPGIAFTILIIVLGVLFTS